MGSEFIDHTPKWLKILAIQLFGTNDKVALKVGMISTIAGFALVSGAITRRNRNRGLAIIAVFGLLGGAVSSNRPSQSVIAFIPSLFGRRLDVGHFQNSLLLFLNTIDRLKHLASRAHHLGGIAGGSSQLRVRPY